VRRTIAAVLAFLFGAAVLTLAPHPSLAQDGDGCTYHPGVARWPLKTSVLPGSQAQNAFPIPLQQFISMPNVNIPHDQIRQYQAQRLPPISGLPVQEGQIVSTVGFLQFAKCEIDDNDYHIQLSLDPAGTGGCLIVEVPAPQFASDPVVSQAAPVIRQFVRDTFFGGHVPTGRPQISARVEVVGQLFFDAPHLTQVAHLGPGGGRGSGGCGANTLWEIHPILAIRRVQ